MVYVTACDLDKSYALLVLLQSDRATRYVSKFVRYFTR